MTSPHKAPPGKRFAVPAYPKAPRRAEERQRKRAMKGMAFHTDRPQQRDMATGRGEQTGHVPNHRFRPRVRDGLSSKPYPHRNSIWPDGRVAKPGRMG